MEEISKSEKKREASRLQELGVSLVALSQQRLERLDLPTKLLDAILEAKRLKSHRAIRRQHQYIGQCMREADADVISATLKVMLSR